MQEYVNNSDIYTIDSLYMRPQLDAIYLIKQGDRLALVDTGTQHSVPQIENALETLELTWQHVDYIILTHVHLDHAGGASALMKKCPNAQLVVHAKGARHMIDPTKLVAGATAVYGEEKFKKMYGTIDPIDEARVLVPEDDSTLDLNGRVLRFIDSPGHANHHHCIIDEKTNGIFTGDAMGLSYTQLRNEHHAYLMPTTTPVQFDPEAMHNTIERVMSYQPKTIYPTHFDGLTPSSRIIAGLHEQIDDMVMMTEQAAGELSVEDDKEKQEQEFVAKLSDKLSNYYLARCQNELPDLEPSVIEEWLQFDAPLNAQGLVFWWQYRRAA